MSRSWREFERNTASCLTSILGDNRLCLFCFGLGQGKTAEEEGMGREASEIKKHKNPRNNQKARINQKQMATQKRHALCGNLLRLQEAFAGVKPASYVGTGCFERSRSRGRRWICVRSRGTANTENFMQQSNRNNTFLLVKLCAATTATIPCKACWYATSSNGGTA